MPHPMPFRAVSTRSRGSKTSTTGALDSSAPKPMTKKRTRRRKDDVRQATFPFYMPSRGEMIMSDKQRFDLTHYPLPKNAGGKTFYDKSPGYVRFARGFRQLAPEGGLGVLSAAAGVGKTAAMRNECMALPKP